MSEQIYHLPSGLTVAVEPMTSTRTASIGVWVGVGSRDEPDELAGVSHFLEHLLFKGTETRSAIEISRSVDRVGGDINAFTSKEYTAFYCRLPARFSNTGIGLLGDVVTAPALRDDDVESERQVILEELAMDDDSPEDVLHRSFSRQLFGEHPLGRDVAGDRATVRTMASDDLREFWSSRYRTGNTVVSVAGAVDPDEVVDQVAKAFDAMPVGNGAAERTAPGLLAAGGVAISDDTEQVHMVTGGRSIDRYDPDRHALDVVNHVLGGGLSSRLFDEIRERRGLAYTVFSSAAAYGDAGAWSIYAGSLPEHAEEVQVLVARELGRLVADGLSADELEIAQGYLSGAFEMGLEDSAARMSRLGAQLTLHGSITPIEDQIARWNAVTLADTARVIERVYGSTTPLTVTLGP